MEFGRIWAEIDLGALNNNLNEVRRRADNGRVLLAIKADAYGHGLREVAQEVADRVDLFGVASTDEGITLRLGGIKNTILVLSPVPYREIPALFEHNLVPSVTETEFARRLSNEAVKRGTSIGLHVEVDTGMGRTGVDEETAGEFIATVAGLPALDIDGVFTHFPSADSDLDFTRHQLQLYERVMARLGRLGISGYLRHTANTAGFLNLPGSRYDLIRPGLVVYGILPDSYQSGYRSSSLKLTPVMSLRSRIVNLRGIAPGRSISYERAYFTKRDSRIAVITAGYGDGYPYSLKNRGKAMVRGSRVPIVGNVCMDLTMLDVTDVPSVQIGDTVTLLGSADGDTITANELAGWAETIPYEITCRVSPRVPRVYLRGGKVEKTRTLLDHYSNG
ncbi:alanine racemase [candidate division WOR-3 bacterium]|nr:alanine racemase [candidate division WOR-3 bacterium]